MSPVPPTIILSNLRLKKGITKINPSQKGDSRIKMKAYHTSQPEQKMLTGTAGVRKAETYTVEATLGEYPTHPEVDVCCTG